MRLYVIRKKKAGRWSPSFFVTFRLIKIIPDNILELVKQQLLAISVPHRLTPSPCFPQPFHILRRHIVSNLDSRRRQVAVFGFKEIATTFLVSAFETTVFSPIGGGPFFHGYHFSFQTFRAEIGTTFHLQHELADKR